MHQSICVFCGSSSGTNAAYRDAATGLGGVLAAQGRRLVYGGGNVGLMGVVADAALLDLYDPHPAASAALEWLLEQGFGNGKMRETEALG